MIHVNNHIFIFIDSPSPSPPPSSLIINSIDGLTLIFSVPVKFNFDSSKN